MDYLLLPLGRYIIQTEANGQFFFNRRHRDLLQIAVYVEGRIEGSRGDDGAAVWIGEEGGRTPDGVDGKLARKGRGLELVKLDF